MSGRPVQVLVVEDDPMDLELTMRALQKHNFVNDVLVARDGVEAVNMLLGSDEHQPVDPLPGVILLDLKLPRLSGLEVLRRIKADPRTRRIPVIMLTSSADDKDIASCYQAGANSYIVKPIRFDQLVEAMRIVGLFWMVVAALPPTDRGALPQQSSGESGS